VHLLTTVVMRVLDHVEGAEPTCWLCEEPIGEDGNPDHRTCSRHAFAGERL
jgi:hypothetical protein